MGKGDPGWVYILINAGMPGLVKIGHSRIGVDDRCLKVNRSGYYTEPFTVAWFGEFQGCLKVELGTHRILEEFRVRPDREFFVTSVEVARDAILRADEEIRHYGDVQAPRVPGAPLPSARSRKLRIPALYAWLKQHHDEIDARISATGTYDENDLVVTPIFHELASEWLSSLPSDYRGRRCQPLGLFMEWGRVHREVLYARQRNRLHLLEDTMMTDAQKRAALAAIQEVVAESAPQRGGLVQWMVENHDEFSQMLSNRRPNWSRLAEKFTELGLSEDGKPLSGETARHYWWRARQIKLGIKPKKPKLRHKKKAEPVSLEALRNDVRVHAPQESVRRPPDAVRPVQSVVGAAGGARDVEASGGAEVLDHDAEALLADLQAQLNKRSGC